MVTDRLRRMAVVAILSAGLLACCGQNPSDLASAAPNRTAKYIVVLSADHWSFAQEVTDSLRQGWRLQGGVALDGSGFLHAQALVHR